MIELFDPQRLLPRRDRSLPITGAVLAVGVLGLGAHGVGLQREMNALQRQSERQQTDLARLKTIAPPPPPALLADLEAQARRLEAELQASGASVNAGSPKPSQWLQRLEELGTPEVSLTHIDIARAGTATIEGQARTPQAMSAYVQAWESQQSDSSMRARAIEVKQDEKAAPLLRFQFRANLPGPSTP